MVGWSVSIYARFHLGFVKMSMILRSGAWTVEKVAARLQQLPQGVWLRVDKKSAEEKRSVMRALSMTDDDFLRTSTLLYDKGSDRILTSSLEKVFLRGVLG